MNPIKKTLAALLCLYYLMLTAWANHQDKIRSLS
jgi:hypothetical protein